MSEASALVRLQEIDIELMRHRKTASELPQRAKVAAARAATKKMAAELTKIVGQRKDIEIELAELDESKKFYSERVTAVQEEAAAGADYHATQDLEAQLSALAKKLEKAEYDSDRLLEKLEAVESTEAKAREVQRRLAEQEQAQIDSWREATAEISAEVKKLEQEREGLVAGISPQLLARYDAAVKRFGGLAVETLEGNRPSTCRVALQPSSYSDIRKAGSDVTTCPYCKRILVLSQEA